MAQSPEELRYEIEQTRADMSRNVDAISERVSPSRIVQRRVDRTKNAVGTIRERVMGSVSAGAGQLGDKAGTTRDGVADAVTSAPEAAVQRTQGNPLAAGLVAFASGLIVAGLLPSSGPEEQAVESLESKLKEPVKEQLGGIARQMKEDLQGPAQSAVQSVKDTAAQAAQTVTEQGKDSAQAVSSDAKAATDEVRSSANGS
ncbi:MAG: hypothetical protein QOI51_878 [Nocardioidaceae bacterium]|jgi:gas vesicle protein|nr:hypothetical protein [Nocardioidaceae bacterium]